jgi:hypothetical protein
MTPRGVNSRREYEAIMPVALVNYRNDSTWSKTRREYEAITPVALVN